MNMDTINSRIKIIRQYFCDGKNVIFAERLGKKPNVTSNWVHDGYSVGPGVIKEISKTFGVSIGWITSGTGDMLISDSEHSESYRHPQEGIPLLPNEAFAGYGAFQYDDLPIEAFYQIKDFGNANFMLRVSGESMSPKFKSGDLVACQKVNEVTFWQWHRIYAICTKNQGILLKRVEKGADEDSICCVSENPAYTPFELNYREIVSVALVLGGVVME